MADHIPDRLRYNNVELAVTRLSLAELRERYREVLNLKPNDEIDGYHDTNGTNFCVGRPEDLVPIRAWVAAIHEVLHEAEAQAGLDLSERIVEWAAWGMLNILLCNPDLQSRILSDLARRGDH